MLSRRNFLTFTAGLVLSGQLRAEIGKRPIYGGWLDNPEVRASFRAKTPQPYFKMQAKGLLGTGQGRQVFLWKALEMAQKGPFAPEYQEIGDCVGQAATQGAQVLQALQSLNGGFEWRGKLSTEIPYAGARVEVTLPHVVPRYRRQYLRQEGTNGAAIVEWMRDYGMLLRGVYHGHDLSTYNPKLATKWASGPGVPDELEPLCKEHPVKTGTLVTSWPEVCDSVASGYPVLICSDVGFEMETDDEGFLKPGSEPWYHAMLIWGIDSRSRRPGGNIVNSWGANWIKGRTHKLGSPAGAFWADAHIIDRIVKQGDSYALSNFVGYPRRRLDYMLY